MTPCIIALLELLYYTHHTLYTDSHNLVTGLIAGGSCVVLLLSLLLIIVPLLACRICRGKQTLWHTVHDPTDPLLGSEGQYCPKIDIICGGCLIYYMYCIKI